MNQQQRLDYSVQFPSPIVDTVELHEWNYYYFSTLEGDLPSNIKLAVAEMTSGTNLNLSTFSCDLSALLNGVLGRKTGATIY